MRGRAEAGFSLGGDTGSTTTGRSLSELNSLLEMEADGLVSLLEVEVDRLVSLLEVEADGLVSLVVGEES